MDNKTAIVTAASQGIGEACARKLSKKNYNLVIMSSSEKMLIELTSRKDKRISERMYSL